MMVMCMPDNLCVFVCVRADCINDPYKKHCDTIETNRWHTMLLNDYHSIFAWLR